MRPDEAIASLASPPEIDVDLELVAKGGLWEFVKMAWPDLEGSTLIPSWHMEQICTHLTAVSDGELKRLIINVPPGCSKSTLTSVMWPAWDWIAHPKRKWMCATFDSTLAARDALACHRLVRSPWYQERWGEIVQIDDSHEVQDTQFVYHTTAKGRRVSVTVGGRAVGWHAEIQVVDDPIKPKDVTGDPDVANKALERAWKWFTQTMSTRRSDPKKFARVIIMQRLHEADLVGRILENDTDHEWTHLMLPMRFEPERACKTRWGGDIRTKPDELLCPDRFDQAAVDEARKGVGGLGEQGDAAQNQQRPAPSGGNIFKREWFESVEGEAPRRWMILPSNLMLVQSWDFAFKDKATADFVAGHVWGYAGAKFYLVDRIHDKMGLPDSVRCVKAFATRWPKAHGKLIEDKANGPAVEQSLRGQLTGIIMMEPAEMGGSKIARANAISPLAQAGNIIFPDPRARVTLANGTVLTYEWIQEVIEEWVTFPFARHDDNVDAGTQAILYLDGRITPRYLEAMAKVASGEVKI